MIYFTTQKLEMEKGLKQKIEFICEFCYQKPIINGNIRKIDKTNLSYVEPHRIIIKDKFKKLFNFLVDKMFVKEKAYYGKYQNIYIIIIF